MHKRENASRAAYTQRINAYRWHAHKEIMHLKRRMHTEKNAHRKECTQRRMHTEKNAHREECTQRRMHARKHARKVRMH
jgi:hypothetical protein